MFQYVAKNLNEGVRCPHDACCCHQRSHRSEGLQVFSHSNPSIFWFSKTFFRIGLTNGYEDGITGVHLKNKKQQDRTMKQFMAGDIGPGEMGCGIELTVPKKHN